MGVWFILSCHLLQLGLALVGQALPRGREPPPLLDIDLSVVDPPLFITHCLSAVLWPSWEVSTTISDRISFFSVQAYKEAKPPQRSQLLSPTGAQSMLVLLAEGWNQLTALALTARAVCAGSAGVCEVTAVSCGPEPATVLLIPSLGEVLGAWAWVEVEHRPSILEACF